MFKVWIPPLIKRPRRIRKKKRNGKYLVEAIEYQWEIKNGKFQEN